VDKQEMLGYSLGHEHQTDKNLPNSRKTVSVYGLHWRDWWSGILSEEVGGEQS
jgi:hypothetical protein